MVPATAFPALLLLGWCGRAAAECSGLRSESLLARHDASELVQVSVALHGQRTGRNDTAAASESAAFWPPDQWQDDLAFLDPEQPEPQPKEKEKEQGEEPFCPDFRTQWTSRVLVYPEKKLAFCYIEKNAGTQFNKLFNKMNGKSSLFGLFPYSLSSALFMHLDVAELTRSNGWTWAIFLRDPLVRYLSAWGSKCVRGEDFGHNCLPLGTPGRDASVDAFESNVLANYARQDALAGNAHWAPQADFCGGLRGAIGYDLVQVLRGDVNAKVREMLRMVNASEQYVDEFFPPRSVSGHHTSFNATDYYQNPEIRQKVEEMYAKDFGLPGLKA